ncbi:hypothetical protein [Fibrobacter intestinalis]|nr:hypothetical protein [Fibrobacter intestinalis]
MKKSIFLLFLIILCAFDNANAYNFKCRSRNGWAPGNGRYSYEGEWIDYFGVYARAGEFVLFYYPRGGHGYWFYSSDCYKI